MARYEFNEVISGRVNVTYPASEHGGSKSESWSETLKIVVDLDESSLKNSVKKCVVGVKGVGTAVAAASAAQVAAKTYSANLISNTLIKGFAHYTKDSFSQQMVELQNEAKALEPQLLTFTASLKDIHKRMESDFNLLKRRYSTFFDGLDEELRREMVRLNNACFDLIEDCYSSLIISPQVTSLASLLDMNSELPSAQNLLQTSSLRAKLASLISQLDELIRSYKKINRQFRTLLSYDEIETPETVYVPIFALETDFTIPNEMQFNCYCPSYIGLESKNKIESEVRRNVADGKINFRSLSNDRQQVGNEFNRLLENVDDKAIREKMLKLWDSFNKE